MVRYPPWILSFTQAHLCDTPFCYISGDNSSIPPQKQARNNFAILSLQVSRDMKSIAAGPLRSSGAQRTQPHKNTYDVLICYHRSDSLFVRISCEVHKPLNGPFLAGPFSAMAGVP